MLLYSFCPATMLPANDAAIAVVKSAVTPALVTAAAAAPAAFTASAADVAAAAASAASAAFAAAAVAALAAAAADAVMIINTATDCPVCKLLQLPWCVCLYSCLVCACSDSTCCSKILASVFEKRFFAQRTERPSALLEESIDSPCEVSWQGPQREGPLAA